METGDLERLVGKVNAGALLTPVEVLALFGRKDRHWPQRAARRGLLEAFNIGGQGPGARYRYRVKLEPEHQPVSEEELLWLELKKRHGW